MRSRRAHPLLARKVQVILNSHVAAGILLLVVILVSLLSSGYLGEKWQDPTNSQLSTLVSGPHVHHPNHRGFKHEWAEPSAPATTVSGYQRVLRSLQSTAFGIRISSRVKPNQLGQSGMRKRYDGCGSAQAINLKGRCVDLGV